MVTSYHQQEDHACTLIVARQRGVGPGVQKLCSPKPLYSKPSSKAHVAVWRIVYPIAGVLYGWGILGG